MSGGIGGALLIDDGETQIMTDGFLSRLPGTYSATTHDWK